MHLNCITAISLIQQRWEISVNYLKSDIFFKKNPNVDVKNINLEVGVGGDPIYRLFLEKPLSSQYDVNYCIKRIAENQCLHELGMCLFTKYIKFVREYFMVEYIFRFALIDILQAYTMTSFIAKFYEHLILRISGKA